MAASHGSDGPPREGGTYALVMQLDRTSGTRVGALGVLTFPEGTYVYAGSAAANMGPRLARHARREKVRHWHVDALTTLEACTVTGAYVFGPGGPDECGIVDMLAALDGAAVRPARFGSSDHRCRGHLVQLGTDPRTRERAVELLEGAGGDHLTSGEIRRRGGSEKRRR